MARSIRIVFAFRAQHKAIQPARRSDGVEAIAAPGQEFVYVGLVADVEYKMISGRIKNVVHRQRQFDHTKVGPEMAASFG